MYCHLRRNYMYFLSQNVLQNARIETVASRTTATTVRIEKHCVARDSVNLSRLCLKKNENEQKSRKEKRGFILVIEARTAEGSVIV